VPPRATLFQSARELLSESGAIPHRKSPRVSTPALLVWGRPFCKAARSATIGRKPMNTEIPRSSELSFLAGGGSLAEIIAGFDWASTPLGPIGSWPISIKTTVGLILRSPVPIVTLWGEQGIMIYNDA
jgi:hypothetical protein